MSSNDSKMIDSLTRDFDLNVEKVLENWTAAHAVREFIANALDEHELSGTERPTVARIGDRQWQVRDFGRGLRYEHLTQNESQEKHHHAERVIGRFGVGLKDALAVLHRRGVQLEIASRHGVITLAEQGKAGFSDVVTLHARVAPPRDPAMRGTAISLAGIADADVEAAKGYFLAFAQERLLEQTPYGSILERQAGANGRIYVNGMVVAEEENFAFSYNVTTMTEPMRRALNRERTHVGRGAYRERVKDMLLAAKSGAVAEVLAKDFEKFASGESRDETKWIDVQLHACKILSGLRPVVFVTTTEHQEHRRFVDYAKGDGRTIVTIPDTVARQLGNLKDVHGEPVASLTQYISDWTRKFEYQFIEEHTLTPGERAVFHFRHRLLAAARVPVGAIDAVRISASIQPSIEHGDTATGVWDRGTRTVIVRRDTLRSPEEFAGTFLHEVAHAISGATDVSLAFEHALTDLLGRVSVSLANGGMDENPSPTGTRSHRAVENSAREADQHSERGAYLDKTPRTAVPAGPSNAPALSRFVCENADGSIVRPACDGGTADCRVRVTRLDDRPRKGKTHRLCKSCGDRLERWAIERFLRVQRGRLKERRSRYADQP